MPVNVYLILVIVVASISLAGLWLVTLRKTIATAKRFQRLFRIAEVPLLLVTKDGVSITCNPAWNKFANVNEEQFNDFKKTYNAHQDEKLKSLNLCESLRLAFEQGIESKSQPLLWTPAEGSDSKPTWRSIELRPMVDTNGIVHEVLIRFIDVTAKVEADADANRELTMLREIVNKSPAVIYVKALDGKYLLLNDQWQKAINMKREDVLGKTDYDTFSKEAADHFRKVDDEVISTSLPIHYEELAPRDGVMHTYYSVKFPIRGLDGKVQAMAGISTDITELKRVENERAQLQVREKTAIEASYMKSTFLANMSHELRTPINGVMGIADLLRSTTLDSDQHNMTDHILHSAESLLTLVNDILDLSKAEAGKIEIEMVNLDLTRTLADVEKTLKLTAEKKGLHLSFSIDQSLPTMVSGDPTRVRQIIMNLVSNALKFTDEGGVGVRIFPAKPREGKPMLRFQINDTGIGLSDEALPKLFTAFSQADASTTRKFGGSGLGLSICKQLVNIMGGDIGVQRRPEGGTQFWFELPLIPAKRTAVFTPPTVEATAPTVSLKILVAEDNHTNQIIATRMLHKLGHTTMVAANGREALKAIDENQFDLILMDCQMPEMDGYEASRNIREGKTRANVGIPIIALTANAMRGDREKCLQAGMTDYVSKPVRVVDIEKAITRVMSAIKPEAA